MAPDNRFAEYTAIMETTGRLSDRRQTTNNHYVSLNVLFLTALGYLIFFSRLANWWIVVALSVMTITATIINSTWLRLIHRYTRLIGIRISYLEGLENLLRATGQYAEVHVAAGKQERVVPFGIFHLERELIFAKEAQGYGMSQLEKSLVWVFLAAFPLVTALIALLTYLITSHIIPPVSG